LWESDTLWSYEISKLPHKTGYCKYLFNIIHLFPVHKGDIIHLFPLHKGDMKICSPEKSHISRGKYDYFKGEQIFISPLCKGNKCFIPPSQRFGEFCQMKSFDHLCLQNYYFGTSLELIALYDQSIKSWEFRIREIRYCWEGNKMLLRGKYDVLINVTWDCFDQSNFYIGRIWLFRGWTHFHISLMQGKWMLYSTRPTFCKCDKRRRSRSISVPGSNNRLLCPASLWQVSKHHTKNWYNGDEKCQYKT
jgi:hypothetical protein